ncbi:hypothetical protein RhiirA5_403644 [Rhizophagus irregularis]|uniref:TTF-type domain-containing protein n=1 Tax=Rhizophagus irregularis TaxID=588596 RepID=A0A2N0NXR8_9GLOM|nr:hypothetical protein RhiirA5_403644 [Rhizophagus irregularis]
MPKEDVEFDNNESSEVDSDLEEADIEVPNNYRRATQKKLNLKKKKVQLLSKRKTGVFQNEWLNIYKWLIYDGSRNLMFCSLCQSHKKQNKFGKEGSKNFKSSALSEHSTTKDHTDATNREIAKVELIKVINNAIDRLKITLVLMKIIFWLAENDISLNKLPEVGILCRIFDCPQLLSAYNTITNENSVSGREILSAISNSIEEIIWKELAEAAAFGIMVDESTDISCEPHLIIYVKYCLTNKLMSFASDGASVMLGRSTGVASRLKEINECLFITHCIAHRLALACNSAEKKYSIGTHQLLWNENYEADLIADILSFASAVVLEIQERFPDRPLLNSMKILDHANWPSNKEELTNYGEEELNMLSEFYKKEINNICGEWFGYKAIIHSNFRNIKIEKLLPRLFEFYYDTFPNIIKLLGIIYSIPFSSVDCERGFSKQNLIKN